MSTLISLHSMSIGIIQRRADGRKITVATAGAAGACSWGTYGVWEDVQGFVENNHAIKPVATRHCAF